MSDNKPDHICKDCGEEQFSIGGICTVCHSEEVVPLPWMVKAAKAKVEPERLNKDDALRILDTYLKSTRALDGMDLPILDAAGEYLKSLRYEGEE